MGPSSFPTPGSCPGHSTLQISSDPCVWAHWVLSFCLIPGTVFDPATPHGVCSWPWPLPIRREVFSALVPLVSPLLAEGVGWVLPAPSVPVSPMQDPLFPSTMVPWSHRPPLCPGILFPCILVRIFHVF